MPLIPTSSCPRVPDACHARAPGWLSVPWTSKLIPTSRPLHSLLIHAASNFLVPHPHPAGSWLFLKSNILWLLLIILLLLYYSVMHLLFRTAFANQRSSPYLHPPFFITLPCCTVFTVSVTIWYYLRAFSLCPSVSGKLCSEPLLVCLVHCRAHNTLGCGPCGWMREWMNLQDSEDNGTLEGLSPFSGLDLQHHVIKSFLCYFTIENFKTSLEG